MHTAAQASAAADAANAGDDSATTADESSSSSSSDSSLSSCGGWGGLNYGEISLSGGGLVSERRRGREKPQRRFTDLFPR